MLVTGHIDDNRKGIVLVIVEFEILWVFVDLGLELARGNA